MKINKFILITLLLISALLIFLKKCQTHQQDNTISLAEVEIYTVKPASDILLSFRYPARVESYRKADIKAQISGILLKQIYTEGQIVKAGDLLFQIDASTYTANLSKVESALINMEANFAQYEKIWHRSDQLYKDKMISTQDRDAAFLNYTQAKSQVISAKEDISLAKINLAYTNISAPINGIISETNLSEGNFISIGDTLTSIIQDNPVYINFAYPENDFYMQKELIKQQKMSPLLGSKAQIIISNDTDTSSRLGIIDYVSSSVDSTTATVNARVIFDNKDNVLTAGQFVRVKMNDTIIKNSIVIPESAIIQNGDGNVVYCVDEDDKIIIKEIVLGANTERGRIVEKGLTENDKVITTGMLKLQIGQKVKISSDKL